MCPFLSVICKRNYCLLLIITSRGAVRGGKVRTILRARRWEGPPREKRDFYRGER